MFADQTVGNKLARRKLQKAQSLPLKAFLIQLAAKHQRKLHLQQLAYYRQSEIGNAAFDLIDKTFLIIGFYAPNQFSQQLKSILCAVHAVCERFTEESRIPSTFFSTATEAPQGPAG